MGWKKREVGYEAVLSDPLTFLVQFICRFFVWFPVPFLYVSLPTISTILVGGACFSLVMFLMVAFFLHFLNLAPGMCFLERKRDREMAIVGWSGCSAGLFL